VPLPEVEEVLTRGFGEIFQTRIERGEPGLRTVSVVVHREGRVLALRRTPERGGFWQPVTGKIEAGESAADAARRELREETGLDAAPRSLDYVHSFAARETRPPLIIEETAFAIEAPAGFEAQRDPAEHDAAEWVTPAEASARFPFEGLRTAVRLSFG
jgi:lipoyl(octanoyl) transferase